MKKLSIVVPVYKVEKYIHACLESVFRQGISDEDFEVIIVNDGTPDRSIDLIEDIIKEHKNIILINQHNQGLSVSRNNGIGIANGRYIIFLDSDDLLADGSLNPLIEIASQTEVDLITADFKRMDDEEINNNKDALISQPNSIIEKTTGRSLFMEDFNPKECYVWRVIYRTEFLRTNNIYFVPGICYEDMPFIHECYLKANRCLKTHYLLYLYRVGHSSITSSINKKTGKDFGTAISKTWELRDIEGLPSPIKEKLHDNIFAAFSVLTYGITHDMQSLSDMNEVMDHLKGIAPDLKFTHGFKQQFVNFMYHKMAYTYILIRMLVVKAKKSKFFNLLNKIGR